MCGGLGNLDSIFDPATPSIQDLRKVLHPFAQLHPAHRQGQTPWKNEIADDGLMNCNKNNFTTHFYHIPYATQRRTGCGFQSGERGECPLCGRTERNRALTVGARYDFTGSFVSFLQ